MCPAVEVFPRDLIFMEFDLPLIASLASALVILNGVPQVFSPRKTLSSGDTKFFRKKLELKGDKKVDSSLQLGEGGL